MGWLNDQTTLVVISAGTGFSGFFMYTPAPGKGNLVTALSPSAGTDPYGNAYPQGFTVGTWDATGALKQNFGVQLNGSIFLTNVNGAIIYEGRSIDGASLWYDVNGQLPGHLLTSIAPSAGTDAVGNAYPPGFKSLDNMFCLGLLLSAGVTVFHPTTINPESWQVVGTAVPFLNSFTAGGTSPRYQLEGVNQGRVRLSGAVNTGAVNGALTPMFTLPLNYRPSRTLEFDGVSNITAYAPGSGLLEVTTNGNVTCVPASTAGHFMLMDGITFELD